MPCGAAMRIRAARHGLAGVEFLVTFGGDELAAGGIGDSAVGKLVQFRMHGLVREIEEERAGPLAFEKGDRVIVQEVGCVALDLGGFAVDVEVGIEVGALAFEADPVMKAGPRRIIEAHVEFADEAGVVAGAFEMRGKCFEPVAETASDRCCR